MDYFLMFIAAGLLYCGYLLGKDTGVKQTMRSLFDTKLLTPEQVRKHYENLGYKKKD